METLPGNVLSNICIRLPAKFVAQMRCVSKPWNVILSKPSFVKSHLNHSIRNNDEILMIFHKGFSFDHKPFTAHNTRSPHIELKNFIKLPITPPSKHNLGAVIGSVNGLVCISNYISDNNFVIYICNPSLSASLTLPPYTMPSRTSGEIDIIFRFGYDPKTDDYKLVKLASISPMADTRFCVVDCWLQVEVYSMKKGSWKFIRQRFPSRVTRIFDEDEVCVDGHDGHIHWLGYVDKEQNQQTIIAFNLNMETFTELPLPDHIGDSNPFRVNVFGVMSGKVCVISRVMDDDNGKC